MSVGLHVGWALYSGASVCQHSVLTRGRRFELVYRHHALVPNRSAARSSCLALFTVVPTLSHVFQPFYPRSASPQRRLR